MNIYFSLKDLNCRCWFCAGAVTRTVSWSSLILQCNKCNIKFSFDLLEEEPRCLFHMLEIFRPDFNVLAFSDGIIILKLNHKDSVGSARRDPYSINDKLKLSYYSAFIHPIDKFIEIIKMAIVFS